MLPHRVGELAPRLVPHVARGRAQEPLVGVALAVLAHVEADAALLVPEKGLRQGLGGLGLPGARGSGEKEDPLGLRLGGALEVAQPRGRPLHHVQGAAHGVILPLHPAAEGLLRGPETGFIQPVPGVLPDAVFVQVHHPAEVTEGEALVDAEAPEAQQLRQAQALREADETVGDLLQLPGMLLQIGPVLLPGTGGEEAPQLQPRHQGGPLLPPGRLHGDALHIGIL